MARLGQPTQLIVSGTLAELLRVDFGEPLHCLALCGTTHPLEDDVLDLFKVTEALMTEAGTAAPEENCPEDEI
jgi:diphthine synthase